YMDANNDKAFASQEALNYWRDVDLYIGGSEHATGHLLYSRFWQKFLFDKGLVPVDEYAKKLINQGMILGTSAFVYVVRKNNRNYFLSKTQYDKYLKKDKIDPRDKNYVSPQDFNWDNALDLIQKGEMIVESS